jgi:hypothetical protein
MARTERGQYHFTVKEGDGDRFFIAAEPSGDVIEKIRGDLLAFDLQPGAMREEAQLVAEMLNRHIASTSLTIVPCFQSVGRAPADATFWPRLGKNDVPTFRTSYN